MAGVLPEKRAFVGSLVSGLSEAIYAYQRRIEDVAEQEAEQAMERIEDVLFWHIKALWDESIPEPDVQDHVGFPDDYQARVETKRVLASLCKDFDLQERLLEHDEEAERYL